MEVSDEKQVGLRSLIEGLQSQEEWAHKRAEIKQRWLHVMGGLPERELVSYERLATAEEAGHTRHHIRYRTAYGDQVTAYLLIPHTAMPPNGFPAIIALHPTANSGKDDIALRSGREGRRYALELAERGYAVLAPDTITAGERKANGEEFFHTASFDRQYPTWSAVGKMLVDHLYGVDLLSSLAEVDADRIGAIGHSLGGYNAYFLAGMDTRIKAAAVSCGLSTFQGDPDPNRWGKRDWFSHLPQLTELRGEGLIDFDFHEIAALAAPAPLFFWIAQQDQYMPHWQTIGEAAEQLHQLYDYLGAGSLFQSYIGTSAHDFPDEMRSLAYRFLDRMLAQGAH
ncbi:dienelactone hydrolase family protein [Paenibacillus sp. GXUN7292]|uniref:dienelactone hydrolase family protein n=1 Tax=Paenibacillus sp. GXUN7292 TaxID=3422499 RepID=UPI003D7E9903